MHETTRLLHMEGRICFEIGSLIFERIMTKKKKYK